MKALMSHVAGGPETLVLEEVPDPSFGPKDLLVDVEAVGINFPDGLFIRDLYQVKPPRPFAPGGEFCGVVLQTGAEVANFEAGDRVIGRCGWGALAERIAIEADRCIVVDEKTPPIEAAGFMFTYATALYALRNVAELRTGERVLVLGAAGGVGAAAVEVARTLGGQVFAAASNDEKLRFALACGAQGGLVYPRELTNNAARKELADAFKALSNGRGFDVVVDPVGGAYTEPAVRALTHGGRHLVIGFAAGIPSLPLNLLLLKSGRVMGVDWRALLNIDPNTNANNVSDLLKMWSSGEISPKVSQVFEFSEAPRAIASLENRSAVGKLVVRVKQSDGPA
ncbi:NADPH:quinone oxidoreductase family protein [Achromobacter sp. NPDC058515]|uniref:NADPH:quinone oxidoreductase family protein n=1 Tax=Achromobacter sp. NPDC058515 TaxID=3346533 RepID=UPI0036592A4F